jgi:hypothetical protein
MSMVFFISFLGGSYVPESEPKFEMLSSYNNSYIFSQYNHTFLTYKKVINSEFDITKIFQLTTLNYFFFFKSFFLSNNFVPCCSSLYNSIELDEFINNNVVKNESSYFNSEELNSCNIFSGKNFNSISILITSNNLSFLDLVLKYFKALSILYITGSSKVITIFN